MIYYLILLLVVWEIYWKVVSLWIAAQKGDKKWFVSILIINSCGFLPIYYLRKNNYFKK